VHEHRNYLPSLGPLMLGCTALVAAVRRFDWSHKAVAGAALIACVVLGGMTWIRAGYWADSLTLTAVTAANHPRSARAHYDMGRLYAGMAVAHPDDAIAYRANAKEHFEISASLDPHRAAPLFGLIRLNSAHGASIEEPVALLAQRLEHNVPQPGTAGWFSNLLNCQGKRVCKIDDQTIADLFQAALRNPKLPNSFRAALLIKASQFMYNRVGDGHMALQLARDAVEASPRRVVYKISLINLYLALGLRSEARQLLEAASKQDTLSRFSREFNAQWERLGISELSEPSSLTDAS
jgi:tetratricopeptide (TPR) repeat protein